MAEEKHTKELEQAPEEKTSIEKLLREREKLDARLKDKFSQQITVMFTDIKGSTMFFETYGDIEGRLMIQRHNEMLFPLITGHGGRVIKTIGDAIMAAFEEPSEAVRAAIDMQQSLYEFNSKKKEKKDQIHIRIGLNAGEGLVEKSDIYGDVVNVAARVESLTEIDEILVSGSVYEAVRKTDDIICRYAQQTKVKGKEEPIEVYRVVWSEEDSMAGATRSAGGLKKAGHRRAEHRRRLEIDISREADTLRITASEKSDRGGTTIRPYEEMRIALPLIEERCREVITLLNRANTRGKVSKDILAKMRDVGQVLFDNLLSAKAKESLRSSSVNDLVFYLEDTLVQIPWELLYDGEQFLCQKFNMGRIVKTKHEVFNIRQRSLARPLKMLIVSDPRGDLENSFMEGQSIRELMDKHASCICANHCSGQITASYIQEKIRNFDIVHYAGHADYDTENPSNSGWLLDSGKFTSADIVKLVGGRPMPSLVFSNACQSGQTEEWRLGTSFNQKIFGLANAFLLAGVQHYIGTFWKVLDEVSSEFPFAFYENLLKGDTTGSAFRKARQRLVTRYGEDNVIWASYVLYGDPDFIYNDTVHQIEDVAPAQHGGHSEAEPCEVTTRSHAVERRAGSKMLYAAMGATAILLLLLLFMFFVNSSRKEQPFQAPARLPDAALENKDIKPVLIALSEKYKEQLQKGLIPGKSPGAAGTGQPTVSVLGFSAVGDIKEKEATGEYLVTYISQEMTASGAVSLVEREKISEIMDELHLSTSDIADQDMAAIMLGRLIGAQLIGTGKIIRLSGETTVSLRVFETATSKIVISLTEILEKGKEKNVARNFSAGLVREIQKLYPQKREP